MKKTIKIILLILIILGTIWAVYYNFEKNKQEIQQFKTTKAFYSDITNNIVATGTLKPKEKIEIKPNISGVIQKIHVKEGNVISKGSLIATVKVIPNVANLNSAKQQIKSAQITLDNEIKNFNRQTFLTNKGVVPQAEYETFQKAVKLAEQNLKSAQDNYKVAATGIAPGLEEYSTTQIRSTINGMILDIPVEIGNNVQEINNFSTGTTIATIADVKQMIFEGKVDESEVGKLHEGMPIIIKVGALPNEIFKGNLTYISPLGVSENGVVQFEIKASILLKPNVFVRAGYSANVEIKIENIKNTLTLKESVVQYDEKGNPFVEVKNGQDWKKKNIVLGISDGEKVQVLSGISTKDIIKIWNIDSKEKSDENRRHRKQD